MGLGLALKQERKATQKSPITSVFYETMCMNKKRNISVAVFRRRKNRSKSLLLFINRFFVKKL